MYRPIQCQIWTDETFKKLNKRQQLIFFYILTSPHSNMLGLYVLKQAYVAADLNMDEGEICGHMGVLGEAGLIQYDDKAEVVFIKNFIEHNKMRNPNAVTGAAKKAMTLPKTSLMAPYLKHLDSLPETWTKGLADAIRSEMKGGGFVKAKDPMVERAERVQTTDREHEKMCKEFGQATVALMVKELNDWKASKNKGKERGKSDYYSLTRWVKDKFIKEGKIGKKSPLPDAEEAVTW
jgi:hypothetical protein